MYLEFILHGSGTSSSVPNVSCLTSNRAPRCPTCWSTKLPSGKKNFRRNTGALIRLRRDEGEGGEWDDESVIMIDAGKTFLAAAQELFPLHGMRKIAALVLTHAHADAMNGLDDLRGWTLHGRIQDHIDIYLARETFQEVKRSFPYLVAKEFATGGGDVPEFRYHIFEEGVPFTIFDRVTITPVAVEHGRFFTPPPPAPPISSQLTTNALLKVNEHSALTPPDTPSITPAEPVEQIEPAVVPYIAYGFVIDANTIAHASAMEHHPTRIVYMSDVSGIPDRTWDIIEGRSSAQPSLANTMGSLSVSSQPTVAPPRTSLVIMDCLRPLHHASHFGLGDAYSASNRLFNPSIPSPSPSSSASPGTSSESGVGRGRSYLVGFSHEFTVAEWDAVGDVLSGERAAAEFSVPAISEAVLDGNWKQKDGGVRPAYVARALDSLVDVVPSITNGRAWSDADGMPKALLSDKLVKESERLWIRPAWDGIRLLLRGNEVVEAAIPTDPFLSV